MTEEKYVYPILEEDLKANLADFEEEKDDDLEDNEDLDLDLDLDDDDDEDEDEDDDFDGDDIVINDIDDEDDDEDDDDEDEETCGEDAPSPAVSNEEDAKFKDLYMRKCADLENFKKRAEKERRDILRFGNEGLIREILSVVDNLDRAIEHLDSDIDDEDVGQATDSPIDSLREGVELTIKNMFAILSKYGVEEIKADGESFDPTKHEAISHEESEEHESGKVVKELQKGYFLKDRLLRPSLVIVAK